MKFQLSLKTASALGILLAATAFPALAQVKVGDNPTQIVSGAKLQVDGDNTTATASKLIVTGAGNTGIGTAAPGTTLDVNGAITNRETAVAVAGNAATVAANTSQVRLTGAATANIAITAAAAPNAGQRLIIYNNTTGGFPAVLNSVSVPMGQAMEFVYSNGGWRATNGGVAGGNFWGILGNAGTVATTNFIGTTDNIDFVARTNNAERMRITGGGNVGIGSNAPGQRLAVVDAANANQFNGTVSVSANNLSAGVGIGWNGIQAVGTNPNNSLSLNGKGTGSLILQDPNPSPTGPAATGNVGIGTNAPNAGAMLEVNSATRGVLLPRISLTSTGTWGLAGTATAGMTVYNTNATITNFSTTAAGSAGNYPTSVNGVGFYTWDGFGWVPENAAPEVLKVTMLATPAGSSTNGTGFTASGTQTARLNTTTGFNTIAGASLNGANGITLPMGTYRINASVSCFISTPNATVMQYVKIMVATSPTGTGDVMGVYMQPDINGEAGYVNGTTIMQVGAAGTTVYITAFAGNWNGGTWGLNTASPASYVTIERIH